MTLKKTSCLVAAVCGLLAISAGEAAAQAPTLAVSANGNSVTIEWTAVPGAQGYNLQVGNSSGAANIADVTVPAVITRIVVAAPSGFYALRVRAVAPGLQGPFSNIVTINVGGGGPAPGPCEQPARPQVKANPNGLAVTINWDNIPGAQYRVEYSRFSGATEYSVTTSQNSHSVYVGMAGTFFVRVVAGNACGTSTSDEVSFKLEAGSPGSGPRSPDPAPGTIIPRASLAYAAGIINQVAAAFPGDLASSCSDHRFLFRVVQQLRLRDSRWGLNYVRGHAPRMSDDVIAFNPTNGPDEGAQQIYLYDIIAGHCTPGAAAWMNDVTDFTWYGGPGRDTSACANQFCARWTLVPYLSAGLPADPREQQ